ncbi:MAG: DUF6541 family protein [Coprococcus sp.]
MINLDYMNDIKYEKVKKIIILLLMLFICTICLIPCMGKSIPDGDDMTFHILRMESIYHALKTGQGYPAYIYSQMLEGYGYGTGIFYPDIFLLPAVLFRFMGASPEVAMKLYIFIILFVTCCTSYITGKCIGRSRYIGIATMILYTMGHYHLEDIYRRSAIGEVVAMAFIPLVFLCLYDFTERQHRRKGLMCFTFSALLLSHTISFVLSVIVAIIWVLIRIKKIWKKELILGLVAEAVACMAVTSFYWLPVLEQFLSGKFYVSVEPSFYTQEDTMTLLDILCGRYSVAFVEIGILVLLIMVGVKEKICNKKALYCLFLTAILLVVETKLFPWKLIDKTPLVSIQFPWRLNMFTEFFVAFGIGVQTKEFFNKQLTEKKRLIQSALLCIFIGLFNLSIVWQVEILFYKDYQEHYIEIQSNTDNIGFGEWLPAEADLSQTIYSDVKRVVYNDNGNDTLMCTYNDDGSLEFDASGISGEYTIPKYYYIGYAVTYKNKDGIEEDLPVYKNKNNGLVSTVLSGNEGMVRVYYKGTFIQKISRYISLIFFMIVAVLLLCRCFKVL